MKKTLFTLSALLINGAFAAGFAGSGTIMGDNQVVVSTKAMGFVMKTNAKEGEQVSKGQLLFEVDKNALNLKLQQAQAMKDTYVADLISVERNLKRFQRLYKKDMVAKVEVENLETAYSKLKNVISVYDSQILEIRDMGKYLTVHSPINGSVVKKFANVGEMYMPGMPAFIITDLENLIVEVDVPEADIDSFKNAIIKVSNSDINYQGFASLDRILPMLNPMTHTFKVKLKIQQNGKLYPGMYLNVEIKE